MVILWSIVRKLAEPFYWLASPIDLDRVESLSNVHDTIQPIRLRLCSFLEVTAEVHSIGVPVHLRLINPSF